MRGNLWTPGSTPREAAPKTALYLPGVAQNNVTTPDSAPTSITGDIDVRIRFGVVVPNDVVRLAAKAAGNISNKSWQFYVTSAGLPTFNFSANGGFGTGGSGNAISLAAGAWHWLRATVDIDNGAGKTTLKFYTSTDGAAWTLNKSTNLTQIAGLFDSTSVLEIGTMWAGTAVDAAALVQRFELRDGIDGTIVAQWNGSYPHTRQRDPQGNIWTVNGTANAWQKVGN